MAWTIAQSDWYTDVFVITDPNGIEITDTSGVVVSGKWAPIPWVEDRQIVN